MVARVYGQGESEVQQGSYIAIQGGSLIKVIW